MCGGTRSHGLSGNRRLPESPNLSPVTLTWRQRLTLAFPFVAIGLLALTTPSDDGPTICVFALCTGTACPGCGMTRAASHLIRGDFASAVDYHPLVPAAALAVAAGWVWFVLRLTGRVKALSQRTLNVILIGSGVALLAVWVTRLALGTLPAV
jgi:hypothetical protein